MPQYSEKVEGTAPADRADAQKDEVLSEDAERELTEKRRQEFDTDWDAEKGNRARAEYFERYSLGGRFQWDKDIDANEGPDPETEKAELTINLLPQFRNEIVNQQRQNRQRMRVRPKGGGAMREAADVLGGIMRDIEYESNAAWAYDWGMEQAVDGGYGYLWVDPVYVDDDSNNQELRISWVPSRFDVVWDKNSRLPWGSDAKHAYRTGWVNLDELEQLGGAPSEAAAMAFGSWDKGWGDAGTWEREEKEIKQVRVCSAWWLEFKMVTHEGVTRPAVKPTLKWCKMTARKIIEGPRELPGHRIPGVRVVGNMKILREGLYLYGLPEVVNPQQDAFNWAVNDVYTRMSMHPEASVIAPEGSMGADGEHEGDWIDAASGKPKGILYYNPTHLDETTLVPPPQVVPFPEVPAGHITLLQSAEHWLRAGTGMFQDNLNQQQREAMSGTALRQHRKVGDTATYHYHDNMTYAMQALGEILIEIIPSYYDWPEAARILNEEGQEEFRQLAEPGSLTAIDGQEKVAMLKKPKSDGGEGSDVLYDLDVGRYAVVMDTGPDSATKREEAAEFIGGIMPHMGEHFLLGADKFLANIDMEGAPELAERFHALALTMYPFLADMEESGPEGPSDKQKVMRLNAQVGAYKQQMEALIPELQRMAMENEDKSADRALKVFEANIKHQIAMMETKERLMSNIVEAEGTIEVEKIRAMIAEMTEGAKATLSMLQGSMKPPKTEGGKE